MTRHTGTSGKIPASASGPTLTLSRTWLYWSLIAGIVALTLTLTTWTAAHAYAIDQTIGDTEQVEPQYRSARQLEHAAAARAEELRRLDEVETRRLGNRANTSADAQTWRPTERYLLWLEYSELRRFRNRAPAWGHPALDAEIERLRTALLEATP